MPYAPEEATEINRIRIQLVESNFQLSVLAEYEFILILGHFSGFRLSEC
jgi:hypothetical protein